MALYRQDGDLALFGQLYNRYMELVYGVCLKYLKQPEEAQDATLQLFEEVARKLRQHEVEQFRPWLYTVAKNHCLMLLRSRKREPHTVPDLSLVQSEENLHLNNVLEKEENFRRLEFCLGQLGDEQRRAIELFYLDGKCYNEIALVTGLEWNKVRSYIQNGRRNLKICMEKTQERSAV